MYMLRGKVSVAHRPAYSIHTIYSDYKAESYDSQTIYSAVAFRLVVAVVVLVFASLSFFVGWIFYLLFVSSHLFLVLNFRF